LSFADKDFKENKKNSYPNIKDHSIFRRRKSCSSMEDYSSSRFCAHFTQEKQILTEPGLHDSVCPVNLCHPKSAAMD